MVDEGYWLNKFLKYKFRVAVATEGIIFYKGLLLISMSSAVECMANGRYTIYMYMYMYDHLLAIEKFCLW